MMSANEPPAADQRRFAEYLIPKLDGDIAAHTRARAELVSAPGGMDSAFLTAADCYLNLLIATCHGSVDTAREVLMATALDATLHEDDPGDDPT
jgi:hypothetical protein